MVSLTYIVLSVALLITVAVARPSSSVAEQTTTPSQSTPSPTVSTVLASDTAIANQFIEGLNLTDFTVPQRRIPEPEKPVKSALTQLRELSQIITSSQTSVSTGKAHQGVAVPMTIEEIEQEMAAMSAAAVSVPHPVKVVKKTAAVDSSTSKDGITTWILLSGTDSTSAPDQKNVVKENQKIDKIAKAKTTVAPNKPNNSFKPSTTAKTTAIPKTEPTKNKFKPKGTGKTTSTTTTTTASPANATTTTTEAPATKPTTVRNLIVKKKVAPVAAFKTNNNTVPENDENEIKEVVSTTTQIPFSTKTTPVPFLILEPKDADFNLPEDRATPTTSKPKGKRPSKGSTKKKTTNKKKNPVNASTASDDEDMTNIKNSTKTAVSKVKPKPMTTQLYNFLAREIMPTVGVGILGLVVTAGIAGYFLNPLGALRRSYEVADRKDDLYYYNNEEYAGIGADGMSEEEVFGKVIAGMPAHGSTYRNGVRFGHQAQLTRPNQYQQKYAGPSQSHGPYARYRNVQAAPQQYSSYQPQQHYGNQRNNISPNMISQKSSASQIYALPQGTSSTTTTTPSAPSTTEEVAVITNANYAPSSSESSPSIVYSQSDHSYDTDYLDNSANPNELKRRTQFVVGTVIDTEDSSAKNDEGRQESDTKYPTIVMPEHGPRRRRRRSVPIITLTPPQQSFDSQIADAEQQYEKLRKRFEASPDLGDKKTSNQVMKEIKRIDYQVSRLRRVVAEAKDIEQFQTELSLEPKNTEMCEMLANGLAQITSDIRFVAELLDEPKAASDKMAERSQMSKRLELKVVIEADKRADAETNVVSDKTDEQRKKATTENTDHSTTEAPIEYTTTPRPNFFLGLLKMMELKTAFGVNVLRSIRPAFDRAVQDVFRVNQTAYNH